MSWLLTRNCIVRYIIHMKSASVNPTVELYGQLQSVYDHFNQELFDSDLPPCVITVQREKNTMGFFVPERWSNAKGYKAHEIALHPGHFANRKLIELFQTMVHEQCHLWQHEFGSPSRTGYHNQEWAAKMGSVGLIPSTTGHPDGKKVGQKMLDYPAEKGAFKNSCLILVSRNFKFQWVDRRPAISRSEEVGDISRSVVHEEEILYLDIAHTITDMVYLPPPENAERKVKVKYHCSICKANVWGKSGLSIRCEECNNRLTTIVDNLN